MRPPPNARELLAAEHLRPFAAQSNYLDTAITPAPWHVRTAPRQARGGRPALSPEHKVTGSKKAAALTRTAARPL
jgi:hypothetical protein